LCDFALVYAYADEIDQIGAKMVLDVVRDKQKGGIFPMRDEEDEEAARIRVQLKRKLNLDIKPMLAKKDIFEDSEDKEELEDLF
jgi:carbamoylphosphate synthase large subunit